MRPTKRPKTPGLVQRSDSMLQGEAEDAHRRRGVGCVQKQHAVSRGRIRQNAQTGGGPKVTGGGFCMELGEGPKNRGLVEQPGSVLQGCAEDARVRGGCGRRVAIACHRRRTGKRSGWAGTGRQMRGRR